MTCSSSTGGGQRPRQPCGSCGRGQDRAGGYSFNPGPRTEHQLSLPTVWRAARSISQPLRASAARPGSTWGREGLWRDFLGPVGGALTSTWPFSAAWCKAVRPPRSETLTLLSRGMITSAHFTALLAAATWSGVCQFLSLALTSAECLISTCTASCNTGGVCRRHRQMLRNYREGGKAPWPHRPARPSEKSKAIWDKNPKSGTEENRFALPFFFRPRAPAHLQNQINLLSGSFLTQCRVAQGQRRALARVQGHTPGQMLTDQETSKEFLNLECLSINLHPPKPKASKPFGHSWISL